MPIKPTPFSLKCPNCGWEVGIAPVSDALTPWEHYDQCPKCENTSLIRKPLNPVKEQIWRLTGKMAGIKTGYF